MENVQLKFHSTPETELNTSLTCFANIKGDIAITISGEDGNYDDIRMVSLNKPTAIRLVKELKKQINFI